VKLTEFTFKTDNRRGCNNVIRKRVSNIDDPIGKEVFTHRDSELRNFVTISDHPRSGVVYNFGRVCHVCLSVCQTITIESLDVGSSYLHIRCTFREYGSGSYIKVIGSTSWSQKQKCRKSLFPQCKTPIAHNSGSIKDRAIRFACIMGFSAMTDRMA